MTGQALLVVDDDHTPELLVYCQKSQDTDRAYLFSSEKTLAALAENYVGLPF